MRAKLKEEKCKEKVYYFSKVVTDLKDNSKMVYNMERELSIQQMVPEYKENIKMAS